MNNPSIQIFVVGSTGSGKTAISNKIKNILQAHGFDVQLSDEDGSLVNGELEFVSTIMLQQAASKMRANNGFVQIETVQALQPSGKI